MRIPMYSVMGGAPVGCSLRIKGGEKSKYTLRTARLSGLIKISRLFLLFSGSATDYIILLYIHRTSQTLGNF